VKEEMEAQYTECFLAVMVDINSYLRSVCMIAKGQMDQVLIASSDVVRAPLVTGVRDFYVVHNHPHRGDIEPSDADLKTTMQLSEMASCVGVQLHDHIIVGHDGFISLLDMMGSWLFVKKIIKPPFKRRKPAKKKTTGKKKK
jgi:DNA repair protein RadC